MNEARRAGAKDVGCGHVTGLQLPCDMVARIDGARRHLARNPKISIGFKVVLLVTL
jgi:hypothetical protein